MTKEELAQREFQRGQQALKRGRGDIAFLRFSRAERAGMDVEGRLLNKPKSEIKDDYSAAIKSKGQAPAVDPFDKTQKRKAPAVDPFDKTQKREAPAVDPFDKTQKRKAPAVDPFAKAASKTAPQRKATIVPQSSGMSLGAGLSFKQLQPGPLTLPAAGGVGDLPSGDGDYVKVITIASGALTFDGWVKLESCEAE